MKLDANGNKLWDRTFGGSDAEYLYALQQTTDGGYILGGSSSSGVSGDKTQPNRGYSDFWIVKLDANGNKLWDRTFGGADSDDVQAMQLTTDGGYLVGGFSISNSGGDKTQNCRGALDYWVLKLDANGNKQWDKTFGGNSGDQLSSLLETRDGGYLLGGFSASGISGDKTQASRGQSDYWVVKLDANGNKLWDRTYGGDRLDLLYALQETNDGGYLLGGFSESRIIGDRTHGNPGDDCWLVKVDANGNKLWDRAYGGTLRDEIRAIQATTDGGYLLAGRSASSNGGKTQASKGGLDYWLVKIDAAGNQLWDYACGGAGSDALNTLAPTTDGGYLAAGVSNSGISGDKSTRVQGEYNLWVVKLGVGTITATRPASAHLPLALYPNPATSHLTLRLPDDAPRTGLHLSLLDATGHVILSQPLIDIGTDIPVEIGPHPAGLYLLRIEGPNGFVATQRVMLE